MARTRETVVLVLDVGPTMHDILPDIEKHCTMLVQKKLMYAKNDEVGIVLFGTEDTKNDLQKEVGGYQHVVVLQDIKVVDDALMDTLRELPRGTCNGDSQAMCFPWFLSSEGISHMQQHFHYLFLQKCKIMNDGFWEDKVEAMHDQMKLRVGCLQLFP